MTGAGGAFVRAARGLRRSPGILVFAVAALALGTAAPTTMYSIAHGVLRDLPVPDGDRLVHISAFEPRTSDGRLNLRLHDVVTLREQQRTMTGLAAMVFAAHDIAAPGERAERRSGARVTANAFTVLGVTPPLGRDFTSEDAAPGPPRVVIIADDLWRTRFGAARDVLDRTLRIDGVETAIIGVMPPGFAFPEQQQLWTPLYLDAAAPATRGGWQYTAFGRLRPGMAIDAARTELAGIARRAEADQPAVNSGVTYTVRPFREYMLSPDLRRIVVVMVLLVSCVLLIAAANVANLLVTRAVARSREVAIRATLGATRQRVFAEHLLEATVIALAGGLLGLALARLGLVGFTHALAPELPYWAAFRLELPVLLFGGAAIAAAALIAGMLPALQAAGVDMNDALRDEARGSSSFRLGRATRALVVIQVAFSCTLLIIAGLMIRGVYVMTRTDGYEPERVLTARFDIRSDDIDTEGLPGVHRQLTERLAAFAGADAAALTTHLPGVWTGTRNVEFEGVVYRDVDELPVVHTAMITPDYFTAAGAPSLRGRDFAWSDDVVAAPVAIVNRSFAARHLPGTDPIGRRLRLFRGTIEPHGWATIIAVAPDVGISTDPDEPGDAVYFPLAQHPSRGAAVLIRTAGDPLLVLPALRSALDELTTDTPLRDVGRLDRVILEARTLERVFGTLFGLFGAAALLLAAVGLYGTMSFTVARRTRELGVRAALGARPTHIVWIALRSGVIQITAGTAAGVVFALIVAPHFGDALFGTSPRDAGVYSVVVLLLAGAGVAAALVPGIRAALLDPNTALRDE